MIALEHSPDLDFAESGPIYGVVVGMLIAFVDDGKTPLVNFPGQSGTAGVSARATIDLHGAAIGREVVLVFEGGDPNRPIIIGRVRQTDDQSLPEQPGHVDIDVDGERLIVTAKEQLVLRCGSASITLTKTGKVLIQGTYLSSRSSGVNRIKGGSIQLN